jgi:hypothetical protein
MNLLLLAVLDPDFMDLSRLFTSVTFVFHVLFRVPHDSQGSDAGVVLIVKRTSFSSSPSGRLCQCAANSDQSRQETFDIGEWHHGRGIAASLRGFRMAFDEETVDAH